MSPRTHLGLDPTLCGRLTELAPGHATVVLSTGPAMVADARGLVHGGFVFGAADHAAMLAVNDPNVVLGAADLRFTAPVAVGDDVVCTATVDSSDQRRRTVSVSCRVGDLVVLRGTLTCFVLDRHVLDGRPE
jgi:acyl-coenzyme A thioesterase PaaI-like protein